MGAKREREFTLAEAFAFLVGMIGIQIGSEVIPAWGTDFYSPAEGLGRAVYVPIGLVFIIFAAGRVFDAFTDPLIGAWSDNIDPEKRKNWPAIFRGRRRPFIFVGTILMTGTFIAFWFPPVAQAATANLIYATVIVCLHWICFTIAMIPLNALGPEIARSPEARVRLGQWQAAGMIIGLAFANIVPGILIGSLDTIPEGMSEGSTGAGMQRTAMICGTIMLICFIVPALTIRERYQAQPKTTNMPAFREMFDVWQNRAFRIYFFGWLFFMLGMLGAQRSLVHWARVGLGGSEETVALLMGPFILTALISAIFIAPLVARFLHVKWLLFLSFVIMGGTLPLMYPIATLDADPNTKQMLGAMLFGFSGIGQGFQYVCITPLLGQLIDLDEVRRGERREAIYNAWHLFAVKMAQALAIVLATQTMAIFGNSVENPLGIYLVGPVAGAISIVGAAFAWRLPDLQSGKTN